MSHTPTPWGIPPKMPETIWHGSTLVAVLDSNDNALSKNQANAAFIVRACNSFDELVSALDAAESILRYAPNISTNGNGTKPSMTTARALEMVRAALAKARGETP